MDHLQCHIYNCDTTMVESNTIHVSMYMCVVNSLSGFIMTLALIHAYNESARETRGG